MRTLLVIGFFLTSIFLSGWAASAAIPPDVMTAYKAYNAALEQKDYKAAIKHAKTAWQKSRNGYGR